MTQQKSYIANFLLLADIGMPGGVKLSAEHMAGTAEEIRNVIADRNAFAAIMEQSAQGCNVCRTLMEQTVDGKNATAILAARDARVRGEFGEEVARVLEGIGDDREPSPSMETLAGWVRRMAGEVKP